GRIDVADYRHYRLGTRLESKPAIGLGKIRVLPSWSGEAEGLFLCDTRCGAAGRVPGMRVFSTTIVPERFPHHLAYRIAPHPAFAVFQDVSADGVSVASSGPVVPAPVGIVGEIVCHRTRIPSTTHAESVERPCNPVHVCAELPR